MKGKLICFIGTDGSGKTTASSLMEGCLLKWGYKCCRVWAAYDLRLFKVVIKGAKRLLMKTNSPYKNYNEYKEDISKVSRNELLIFVYKLIVFLEYWFQVFYKVIIPLLIGRVVICDRYVFDVVINISSNLNLDETRFIKLLRLWLSCFPKPDLLIFVSVPPEVSLSRKNDIPDIDYVKKRHKYYKIVNRYWDAILIDGTRPMNEIDNLINYISENFVKNYRI